MSDRWDGWDGIGYHRSSKSTFVANNLNFKGFVHIDWIVKFQTLLWCCLENGRESSTMWRLKANWKGRTMVVDKDKGLPLPADWAGQTKQTVLITAQTVCLCPPRANRAGQYDTEGEPFAPADVYCRRFGSARFTFSMSCSSAFIIRITVHCSGKKRTTQGHESRFWQKKTLGLK